MDWLWYIIIIAIAILLIPIWLYVIARMLTWAAFSSWEQFFRRHPKTNPKEK